MKRNAPIQGSDLDTVTPVNGRLLVAGIIQSPHDMVSIRWEVDGASGSTECESWAGQHCIDQLTRAGYRVISVSRHY